MTSPLSLLALWILGLLVPRAWRDSVQGDLAEEYAARRRAGRHAGLLWQCAAAGSVGVRLAVASRLGSRPPTPHRLQHAIDRVWTDVTCGVRGLTTHRRYTALAVLTLALGIGANAAVFSVADWLLFRPIPGVQDQDDLVGIGLRRVDGIGQAPLSLATIDALRAGSPALSDLAGFSGLRTSVDFARAGRTPLRANADIVTSTFFDVLRVRLVGRGFTADEGRDPAAPAVAVIGNRISRLMFDADADALGQTVSINGTPVTIVGIAPRGFHGTQLMGNLDLWLPAAQWRTMLSSATPKPLGEAAVRNRDMFGTLVGRLAPGGSRDVLHDQIEAVRAGLRAAAPASQKYSRVRFTILPDLDMYSPQRQQMRQTFVMLLALSAVLLALACANVSNSVMARSTARTGEIATRLALGASRLAVARLLFIESLLLSLLSAAAALVLAWILTRSIEGAVLIPGFSPVDQPALDWRVVAWAIGLATITAVGTGLLPMWSVRRADLALPLRRAARAHSARRQRLRTGLMAVQIAASVVLLVGAGLLVRSVVAKLSVDAGFDASRVFTFSVNAFQPGRSAPAAFHRALVDRVRQVPGVRAASLAFLPPFFNGNEMRLTFHPDDRSEALTVARNSVLPGFFDVLGLAFVEGRDFTDEEATSTEPFTTGPLILTEPVAQRLFGHASAVGRTVVTSSGVRRTIVGVVRASRQRRLLSDDTSDIVFEPFRPDFSPPWVTVILAASSADTAVWPGVRRAVAAVAPTLAMFNVMSVDEGIRAEFGEDVLAARIAPVFAGLAMAIAVIGFYGILSRTVIERHRELGIRAALGATTRDVTRLITREALTALLVGLLSGAVLSAWLSHYLESRLYEISRVDPVSFGGAVGVLTIATLLSAIPVWRRLARLNPSAALRE